MRVKSIAAGLTLVLCVATAGSAQQTRRAAPGYLGFRFDEVVTRGNSGAGDRITVREVSKDSPAEKAGIRAGDELLRINGMAATNGKFAALARTLVEGDTVRLRVRRDGKERDHTIVAEARPAGMAYITRDIVIEPDTIRRLMLKYLDSARVHLDSVRLPRIYIEPGDSGRSFFFKYSVPPDSLFFKKDSALARIFRGRRDVPPGAMFEFDREVGPGMIFHSIELGARAVGGAEFITMDPSLADYFGTQGLLTLRVLPETPADRAGLQAGDVVTKAKGRTVHEVDELRAIVAANPDGVTLDIRRKGQNKTVELKTRSH